MKEEMRKEMMGSPSGRRGKTSREHSVHFPDSLMAEQEKGSAVEAEVDTVDLGRKGESKEVEGGVGGGEGGEGGVGEGEESDAAEGEERQSGTGEEVPPPLLHSQMTCLLKFSLF